MQAWMLYLGGVVICIILLIIKSLSNKNKAKLKADSDAASSSSSSVVQGGASSGVTAAATRNRGPRNRMRGGGGGEQGRTRRGDYEEEEEGNQSRGINHEGGAEGDLSDGEREEAVKVIGKKKQAKLEAKEERRLEREREERERAEKKRREELIYQERLKQEEKERLAEELEEKREQDRLAEIARKEEEEYQKWKLSMEVGDEGEDAADGDGGKAKEEDLINKFVEHIKENKVIVLEDLGVKFKLKQQDVIVRVKKIEEMGLITGLMDDRGKYIYISEKEMKDVAKFLRQQGRVSLQDISERSNRLIDLNSAAKKDNVQAKINVA
eukprot:Nk52_evm12s263 gene=Nk52_evmTU12s263